MKIYQILIIICIGAIWLMWSIENDQKMMQASEKYEACVQEEYGTTPASWYALYGVYPPCQITAQ